MRITSTFQNLRRNRRLLSPSTITLLVLLGSACGFPDDDVPAGNSSHHDATIAPNPDAGPSPFDTFANPEEPTGGIPTTIDLPDASPVPRETGIEDAKYPSADSGAAPNGDGDVAAVDVMPDHSSPGDASTIIDANSRFQDSNGGSNDAGVRMDSTISASDAALDGSSSAPDMHSDAQVKQDGSAEGPENDTQPPDAAPSAEWSIVKFQYEGLYESIWGSSPSNIFFVGSLIERFDGTNFKFEQWIAFATGIWGTSHSNIYIPNHDGTVNHFDGSGWSPIHVGTHNPLWAIWGSGANDVFVVGRETIAHYNGNAWTTRSLPSLRLIGIWGNSTDNVFAVGYVKQPTRILPVVMHYNGANWVQKLVVENRPGDLLTAVWGSGPTDVFAVGSSGLIYHFNGTTWSRVLGPTEQELRSVWGTSGTNVYVVGNGGTILHHEGNQWRRMTSGTKVDLSDVWGTDEDNVYAVGSQFDAFDSLSLILRLNR